MERFAKLVRELQNTTRTTDKRDALVTYLQQAPDADKVWLVALLTGRRPKRLVNTTILSSWALQKAGLPEWLFSECYHTVGDLAETISLILPAVTERESPELSQVMLEIRRLQSGTESDKFAFINRLWSHLDQPAVFVFNKIIIGGFRMGVSQNILIQALAAYAEKDVQEIAHLISGNWDPYTISFKELIHENSIEVDASKLYPFCLAYALEQEPEELGSPSEWQVEWKWDGIRGQMIRRQGSLFVWSRGEELITHRFPEFQQFFFQLPDGVVLDGEILSWADHRPLPFQYLQTRVTRKSVSKKQLAAAPVVFLAYDLLELEGKDLRQQPLSERRKLLEQLVARVNHPNLLVSPLVQFEEWKELSDLMTTARERGCEGFMLKRKASTYQAGRRRGDWWKWKIDPLSVDAVLIYAQKGSGKRGSLFTAYTFAVRDGEQLVPFARAYSGLTDKEIMAVDRFIRQNSLETFGPVRTVKPELVFEIGFEGISRSNRHKSGVAVRFPRMLRWRQDKNSDEINTIDDLKQLLGQYGTA